MNPIALPSIFMLAVVAALSAAGASILSKPWMRRTAASLAVMEAVMALFLVFVGVYYR